jgi:hypothetical protein
VTHAAHTVRSIECGGGDHGDGNIHSKLCSETSGTRSGGSGGLTPYTISRRAMGRVAGTVARGADRVSVKNWQYVFGG